MAQPVAGAFLSSRLCRAGRSLLSTLGHPETVRHYFVCRGGPFPFATRPDAVKRLFENYVEIERAYYRRTKIFPIMHTVVIRRELYRANRWIAQSLYKAFVQAQRRTYETLATTMALATMLPWQVAHVEEARRELGEDWWPYGFEPNRHVLETFLRYHHEQGLSKRLLKAEELFAPETLESFRV